MKIITLTLSPCFDVHCHAEQMGLGKENIVRTQSFELGGKGINVSRVLYENGIDSTAVVALARQGGAEVRDALDLSGLNYRTFEVDGRVRNNITVHAESGEETRISFDDVLENGDGLLQGVSAALSELCDSDCILVVAGSVPKGVDIEALCYILTEFREKGVRLVIDSRSFDKSHLARLRPWLIKPNEEEIRAYIGEEVNSPEDATSAARELRELGIDNVMVTLGGAGAVLCCDGGEFFVPSPKVTVLSTIGAGDSTIAGFLAATSLGISGKRALEIAVCYGAAACMREGTNPPRSEDIELLLKSF